MTKKCRHRLGIWLGHENKVLRSQFSFRFLYFEFFEIFARLELLKVIQKVLGQRLSLSQVDNTIVDLSGMQKVFRHEEMLWG